jgi:hypothetical protein
MVFGRDPKVSNRRKKTGPGRADKEYGPERFQACLLGQGPFCVYVTPRNKEYSTDFALDDPPSSVPHAAAGDGGEHRTGARSTTRPETGVSGGGSEARRSMARQPETGEEAGDVAVVVYDRDLAAARA